ncbi:hypothetical protein DFH09DRAFT_1076478 [Mycena vulgaris]|nr:hypothetical protein DFH09DRAFT_1076478 [Mycena vulgaris]
MDEPGVTTGEGSGKWQLNSTLNAAPGDKTPPRSQECEAMPRNNTEGSRALNEGSRRGNMRKDILENISRNCIRRSRRKRSERTGFVAASRHWRRLVQVETVQLNAAVKAVRPELISAAFDKSSVIFMGESRWLEI